VIKKGTDLYSGKIKNSRKIRTSKITFFSMNIFMVIMAKVWVQATKQDGQVLIAKLFQPRKKDK
jgi:hypothetical protein